MADIAPPSPAASDTPVGQWLRAIGQYDAEFKKWTGRSEKILKKYRDEGRAASSSDQAANFNIIWSNVNTLVPATYSKMPKADVSRRFSDTDAVGRVASLLIERALDYEIEHYPDFRSAMHNCVFDRFLGGRGVSWVRYEPHVVKQDTPEDGLEITDDAESEYEAPEEIESECSPTDYVHWKDFGHSQARVWEEVTKVWRVVYLSQSAAEERFPDKLKTISFNSSPDRAQKYGDSSKINDKAKIYEGWDLETGKVVWIHPDLPDFLDEVDDPLGLEGFFPCPKPLYATLTSDSLVPVPDFCLYQDQAAELDILADRIDGLVKALKVRGVYNSSIPALQRLLTEGENNTLIPVEQWGAFSEKGGLKGSVDILPIDMLASTLLQCYQAMAQIKGQIYEITGISDIIRGEGAASETATAQQIKGQYAGLRLRSMQEDVAMFASDLLRLKAQIVCTKYQPQTILQYAAAGQMAQADQELIPQAIELIKQKPLRNFRVQVDADSLVQLDESTMKQERVDFLNAFANFLREALPAGQQVPELGPMLMELMKFGVSGFKQARSIEGVIDVALQQLTQKAAQQSANPQPSPEQQKMQAEQQAQQVKLQAEQASEQARIQADVQIAQMKAQADAQLQAIRHNNEGALRMHEMQMKDSFERWKAELNSATQITIATISAKTQTDGNIIDLMQQANDAAEGESDRQHEIELAQMAPEPSEPEQGAA